MPFKHPVSFKCLSVTLRTCQKKAAIGFITPVPIAWYENFSDIFYVRNK